jgi:hypothetical protein
MAYVDKVNFSVTGKYGNVPEDEDDVYTIEEFEEYVDSGAFIDYDGFRYPVKDSLCDPEIIIKPSSFKEILPEDATHIVWYNR